MTQRFIEFLNPSYIPHGAGGERARDLFRHWSSTKGTPDAELIKYARDVVWFDGADHGSITPPILSCGVNTLTALVTGKDAQDLIAIDDSIGEEYRRFAHLAYRDAAVNRIPNYSIVSSNYTNEQGDTFDLMYERLILPYRNPKGVRHLLLTTNLVESRLTGRKQDRKEPRQNFLQATVHSRKYFYPVPQVAWTI